MEMKNGQMAGEILIYVLAIIIFSLTLIYGYNAIKSFTDKGTEISSLQLENDIKNEVEKVTGDTFGTIVKKVLTIPGNYKEVCFVRSYPPAPTSLTTNYALINNAIGKTKNNMFLAPDGSVGFNIGVIDIEGGGNFKCIDIVGARVILKLEAKGDYVTVSEWQ